VIVVVTGTGTEVGKTYVTAALARRLGARARKPVQSFAKTDATTDADVLAQASGEPPELICPRWLPIAVAPPMAAAMLGEPAFTIDDLIAALDIPIDGITLVEGAGGLLSPIANDGDTRALIDRLQPDVVVLVADAGLGTINVVRLCVEAMSAKPIVYLNRFDETNDLHRRNAEWLRTREGLEIVTDLEALAKQLERR